MDRIADIFEEQERERIVKAMTPEERVDIGVDFIVHLLTLEINVAVYNYVGQVMGLSEEELAKRRHFCTDAPPVDDNDY